MKKNAQPPTKAEAEHTHIDDYTRAQKLELYRRAKKHLAQTAANLAELGHQLSLEGFDEFELDTPAMPSPNTDAAAALKALYENPCITQPDLIIEQFANDQPLQWRLGADVDILRLLGWRIDTYLLPHERVRNKCAYYVLHPHHKAAYYRATRKEANHE